MPTNYPPAKKKKPADVALIVIIFIMIGVGVWMIIRENQSASAPADLPSAFVYDIDRLKKIDPKLITFSESSDFKADLESLLSLSVFNTLIYVSGDGGLKAYDHSGELKRTLIKDKKVSSFWIKDETRLYAALDNRVVAMDLSGAVLHEWPAFADKCNLRSITGNKDRVYIGDSINRVIYVCDNDGKLVRKIGESEETGLVIPGPHLDLQWNEAQQQLFVVNPGRHRIDSYAPSGDLLQSWGEASMTKLEGFSGCCNPTSFALWPDGGFVTSEKGLNRIKRYDQQGNLVDVVAGPKQFAKQTRIYDMEIDANGTVFVLDNERKQVRIFKPNS